MPSTERPWPAGHVAHAAQLMRPALAVNVPGAQSAQVRSLLAVAVALVYLPGAQGLLTATHAAVPPLAENVAPLWHGVHVLSAVAEPAAKPKPAEHVAHAAQLSVAVVPALALALNVPVAHAWHSRSLLAVAPAEVNEPAAHVALTAAHASPLLTDENVEPTTHGAHWRSAAAEPSADLPSPTAHLAHTAQLSVAMVLALTLALKVPKAHAVHTTSLLALAAVVVNVPAAHGALTATHASPLSSVEYVEPATHAAHWRSAVAEPATDMPCPAGHVVHAAHASLPAVALNVPSGHALHTRLDVLVNAVVSYSPTAHVEMSWHTRSELSVAAVKMNWCASHVLCELQPRSLLSVGAACSYSVPLHDVTATHASSLSTAE